jgi:Ribbon-helix-helix protein, copG family
MAEEISQGAARRAPSTRWRKGRKPVNAWLPSELVARVHECRIAEGRSLTAFLERALSAHVELAEKYAVLAAPGRGRRR